MKTHHQILVLSGAVMGALLASASASTVVISNLEQAGQPSTVLRGSNGFPLPVGTGVTLVAFPGKTDTEIAGLAASGTSALLAAASVFGQSSVVGEGSNLAGLFEFLTGAPLSAPLQNPHVLVTKEPNELLLLRLPRSIPADELAGPEGHIAIHLDDAVVVYGSRNAIGFSTAVSPLVVPPTPFEAWILSELGAGTPAADRLPEADADRDGMANLMEYASGSDPGAGGSMGQVRLRSSPEGVFFVQYLRRIGASDLAYTAERLGDNGAGPWVALAGIPVAPVVAPSPAPAAFEWVEQSLPSGASGFARLRVELVAP